MRKALKSRLTAGILIMIVVCLGIVFAGDVIVKDGALEAENINATGNIVGGSITATGTIEGEIFKSTGCTATGTKAVAFGTLTEASGVYSTAMGYNTTASGTCSTAMGYDTMSIEAYSTAMGYDTTASGDYSTAMGYYTTASGSKSTALGESTTASGSSSTAMGRDTTASGNYSTAMGDQTTASGYCSTAMGGSLPGLLTTASGACSTAIGLIAVATGDYSTAMGYAVRAGPASYSTAIGRSFINDVQDSFAVGYGQMDFRVESGLVTVGDPDANTGNLFVGNLVDCNSIVEGSSFYDKDTYGSALDYSQDSSKTIKVNPEGKKGYNHEADPVFLQARVTVKDYDKYTEEEVWDDVLKKNVTRRIYQTHQELRSSLSMKVAWLRQCVFELKQENQTLKEDIAKLKEAVGIE